jgi:hypothetical protein
MNSHPGHAASLVHMTTDGGPSLARDGRDMNYLTDTPWEAEETEAAAREAAAIGGHAGDEELDPAQRPLVEAGEGEAEGFELAEADLINAAEDGDSRADPLLDAFTPEVGTSAPMGTFGEADHEKA